MIADTTRTMVAPPWCPWAMDTPLQDALAEIWGEGLGNYYSLSPRWLSREGRRSETASRALAVLEPRFVARMGALACATPEEARDLTADLSNGPFDHKWGALPAALWPAPKVSGTSPTATWPTASPPR